MVGPPPQGLGDLVGEVGVAVASSAAVRPKNIVVAAARTSPAAARLLERLQQALPVGRRRRGEDVGVAGVDGRDPGRGQRVAAGAGVDVALDDDRDVVGLGSARPS